MQVLKKEVQKTQGEDGEKGEKAAEEAAEALQLDEATPVYEDAQRKLQLLEQQHAAILF